MKRDARRHDDGTPMPGTDLDVLSVELANRIGSLEPSEPTGLRQRLASVRALPVRSAGTQRDLLGKVFDRAIAEPLPALDEAALTELLVDAGEDDDAVERVRRITTLAGSQVLARSVKFFKKLPTGKALVAITGSVEVAVSVRRGVRELQAIASHLVLRARAAGVEPDRRQVERAAVWAYLLPQTPYRADEGGGLARRLIVHWSLRAVRPESDKTIRKRSAARAAAAARIPLDQIVS